MRIPVPNQKLLISLVVVTAAAFAIGSAPAYSAGGTALQGETYTWSAELVSFDSATNTAVVQARIESHAGTDAFDAFTEGERLILTWTGLNRAAGVRGLHANPNLMPNTLSLPVEFVSTELDGGYVRFRIPVPDGDVARIAELKSGAWVTGTSPKMAIVWSEAISSLRHYNDID